MTTNRAKRKHVELSPEEWDRLAPIGESDGLPTPAMRRALWRIAFVEAERARTNLRAFYGIANQRDHGRRPTARERRAVARARMQWIRREINRLFG